MSALSEYDSLRAAVVGSEKIGMEIIHVCDDVRNAASLIAYALDRLSVSVRADLARLSASDAEAYSELADTLVDSALAAVREALGQ